MNKQFRFDLISRVTDTGLFWRYAVAIPNFLLKKFRKVSLETKPSGVNVPLLNYELEISPT